MTGFLDPLLVAIILTSVVLAASSRLAFGIRLVAAQGVVAGLLPLILSHDGVTGRLLVIAVVMTGLKGVVFPQLLYRALRQAAVQREDDPPFGYTASIVGGVITLGMTFWLTAPGRLPMLTLPPLAAATSSGRVHRLNRSVSDRRPQQRAQPGSGVPCAGKRHLPDRFSSGLGRTTAAGNGHPPRCILRSTGDGGGNLPHQPCLRLDRG